MKLSSINDLPEIGYSDLSTDLNSNENIHFELVYDNQSYKISLNNFIAMCIDKIGNSLSDDLANNNNNPFVAALTNLPYVKLSGEYRPFNIIYDNNLHVNTPCYISSFLLATDERTNTNFLRVDGNDNEDDVPYIKINNETRQILTENDFIINTNNGIVKIINSDNNKIEACTTSALWN